VVERVEEDGDEAEKDEAEGALEYDNVDLRTKEGVATIPIQQGDTQSRELFRVSPRRPRHQVFSGGF